MNSRKCGTIYGCGGYFPSDDKHFKITDGRFSAKCINCIDKCRNDKSAMQKLATKNYQLKENYGIDLETYNALNLMQNHKCGICGSAESRMMGDTKCSLSVKKFTTYIVLICSSCNRMLTTLTKETNVSLEDKLNNLNKFLRA